MFRLLDLRISIGPKNGDLLAKKKTTKSINTLNCIVAASSRDWIVLQCAMCKKLRALDIARNIKMHYFLQPPLFATP